MFKPSQQSLGSVSAAIFAFTASFLTGCDSGGTSSSVGEAANSLTACSKAKEVSSYIVGHDIGTHIALSVVPHGGAALRKLHGHVLTVTQRSSDLGKIDDNQDIPITVSLNLKNPNQLEQELSEIYQPGSPKFHQFLKSGEFRARFGPSTDQIAQVTAYLESRGLSSVTPDANGLLVHAVGKAKDLSAAFQTEIHQYKSSQGVTFFANSNELQVPGGLEIQGVHGLHNYTHAHTHLKGPSGASSSGGSSGKSGSGPGGGYAPADIRNAYEIPSSLDGSGQTLAVFELDGYNSSNIATYEQQFGLPATPLQNVLVDGASGSAGGGEGEVELDIELMIALAPKASKILVYEGTNSDQGMLDTYNRIASDNLAKSVSTSWGSSEDSVTSAFIQSENTIFMQMAAQGQTIYSASGDTGANDNGSSLGIDDPSGQPYVVAVGGTSLTLGANGAYSGESTWNDGSGAGGGGISKVWSIPSWQQGLSISSSKGSSTMRMIPDVALNADINQGYAIYTGGTWGTWGGTSASAPLWAAFNALVNQQRQANGLGPVGYVTPLIYSLGQSSRYSNDFNDIADNSTNGYYPAVAGYDLATGWGSFKATSLLNDLSTDQVAPPSSNPPTGTCSAQ